MDRVVSSTFLMLMLTMISCAEKDPKCEGVNKNLPREDLHKIFGDWVLVWSTTNIPNSWETYNLSSSQLRVHLHPDNKTVVYEERNHLSNSSCHSYDGSLLTDHAIVEHHALKSFNATVDYDGHMEPYMGTGHKHLYESNSPNDLVLVYVEVEGRFLLIYRRKGHHTGKELKSHHKQHQDRAACLGFPVDDPFIYDGVSELCHECDHKMKNLPREDLHKIFGDWFLVWSSECHRQGSDFDNFTSAHVHISLQPDNKTVVYHEKTFLSSNSSCHIWKENLLADHANAKRHILNITSATVDFDGHVGGELDETGHLELYESGSSDELVLVYVHQLGQYLLVFHRKGQVLKVDHKQQQDRAACLGIPVNDPFVYDGVTPLCDRKEGLKVLKKQNK